LAMAEPETLQQGRIPCSVPALPAGEGSFDAATAPVLGAAALLRMTMALRS